VKINNIVIKEEYRREGEEEREERGEEDIGLKFENNEKDARRGKEIFCCVV